MTQHPQTSYRVRARHAHLPDPDWRDQLAQRLGARPRRLGLWTELALYGALRCLEPQTSLPAQTALLVSSQFGPAGQMQEALAQSFEGLPLPLSFLQIQPSQLLATLSAQLAWQGDARCVAHAQPLFVLAAALAMVQRVRHDVLVGWVETHPAPTSYWLHLTAETSLDATAHAGWLTRAPLEVAPFVQTVTHARLDASGPAVIIKS